jgi:hypothetical protein
VISDFRVAKAWGIESEIGDQRSVRIQESESRMQEKGSHNRVFLDYCLRNTRFLPLALRPEPFASLQSEIRNVERLFFLGYFGY